MGETFRAYLRRAPPVGTGTLTPDDGAARSDGGFLVSPDVAAYMLVRRHRGRYHWQPSERQYLRPHARRFSRAHAFF